MGVMILLLSVSVVEKRGRLCGSCTSVSISSMTSGMSSVRIGEQTFVSGGSCLPVVGHGCLRDAPLVRSGCVTEAVERSVWRRVWRRRGGRHWNCGSSTRKPDRSGRGMDKQGQPAGSPAPSANAYGSPPLEAVVRTPPPRSRTRSAILRK